MSILSNAGSINGDKLARLLCLQDNQAWDVVTSWLNQTDIEDTTKKGILCSLCETEKLPVGLTYATPFAWACFKEARDDIIRKMLELGGREMIMKKDSVLQGNGLQWALANRVQLNTVKEIVAMDENMIKDLNADHNNAVHIATRFDNDYAVVDFLIEKGGKEVLKAENVYRASPIHYACKYHSDVKVIKLITEAASCDSTGKQMLQKLDLNGVSPIAYAFKGGANQDIVDFILNQLEDSGIRSLSHNTLRSMLLWMNNQTELVKSDVLGRPFIKRLLNVSFVNPLYMSIALCDVYAQLSIVGIFSYGFDESVIQGDEAMNRVLYWILVCALSWRVIREFLQIISSPMGIYITDVWNLVDLILLILVTRSVIMLKTAGEFTNREGAWICYTTGFAWLELILVLSHLRYEVLVFVVAAQEILLTLIPFYIVTLMIIFSYATMLYQASLIEQRECGKLKPLESVCTRLDSLFATFSMTVNSEWIYFDELHTNPLSTSISMGFAIIIGIFLLNVLIVEISRLYMKVDRLGRFEFWRRRLAFMNEISVSFSTLLRRLCHDYRPITTKEPIDDSKRPSLKRGRVAFSLISTWIYKDLETMENVSKEEKEFFLWYHNAKYSERLPLHIRLKIFFTRASLREIILPGESFERVISEHKFISRTVLFIFYPIIAMLFILQVVVGFALFGVFWPRSMKMFLFHGPVDEPLSSGQIAKDTQSKILHLEKNVAEMHNELKSLKEVNFRILSLLQAPRMPSNRNFGEPALMDFN